MLNSPLPETMEDVVWQAQRYKKLLFLSSSSHAPSCTANPAAAALWSTTLTRGILQAAPSKAFQTHHSKTSKFSIVFCPQVSTTYCLAGAHPAVHSRKFGSKAFSYPVSSYCHIQYELSYIVLISRNICISLYCIILSLFIVTL